MRPKDLFYSLSPDARILFIRLRSMGDCLLLTGPVRALKEEFSRLRVSVLVESRFAGCFDGNPDFDEVIHASGKLSTVGRLFSESFDLTVNLHGGPTSLAYTIAAGGVRIGAEQYQYRRLYDALLPRPDTQAHTVESTMAGLQFLGIRAQTAPALRYEFHQVEAARMDQKIKTRPYIVIHPASVMATKRWHENRFAEVALEVADMGFAVVITAGPGEEPLASRVAQRMRESTILLGLSIPELAELIRGARLYIGNDSGPMHLAAAVGTPTVAVWGSSDSRRWHPWNVQHRVIQNPFECNPCPGYRCLVAETPLCIESVTVDQVKAAAKELLANNNS